MIKEGDWSSLSGVRDGFFLVVDKPLHVTSFDVVHRLRRLLGIKRIGHAGTLDPLASGVLPIAVGEACRLLSHVVAHDKSYAFTVEWGKKTETGDLEGALLEDHSISFTKEAVEAVLEGFRGGYDQTPPIHSAIRINGERAYARARRGEAVVLPARFVAISHLEILEHQDVRTTFRVDCGKGTYVRSLAEDIASRLGTCGVVSHLRRLRVGNFSLSRAIALESAMEKTYNIEGSILHLRTVLDGILAWRISEEMVHRIRHGQRIKLSVEAFEASSGGCVPQEGEVSLLLYDSQDVLVAIATYDGHLLRPRHVFK